MNENDQNKSIQKAIDELKQVRMTAEKSGRTNGRDYVKADQEPVEQLEQPRDRLSGACGSRPRRWRPYCRS